MGRTHVKFAELAGVFLFLYIAVVQSHISSVILLEKRSRVEAGSVSYNASSAVLDFKLTLSVNETIEFAYDKELSTVFEVSLEVNVEGHNCRKTQHFSEGCPKRKVVSPIFNLTSEDYTANFTGSFDHVYSGCYVLNIKRCTPDYSETCSEHDAYAQSLGHFETKLTTPSMKKELNTRNGIVKGSIRVTSIDGGFELEFGLSLLGVSLTGDSFVSDRDNRQIIPFKKFQVELKYISGSKAWPTHIVNTTYKRIKFYNSSNENCVKADSHEKYDVTCITYPVGNYTITVSPIDSRCNNPRICDTLKNPCKWDIVKYISFAEGVPLSGKSVVYDVKTPAFSILYILIPFAVLFACVVSFLAFFYLKHRRFSRRASQETESNRPLKSNQKEVVSNLKVLFVYDTNDESITNEARLLRRKLTSLGVSVVFDAGDPDQKEDIIIAGEYHWFLQRINDPNTKIIVIRSQGMEIAQDSVLNKERAADPDQDHYGTLPAVLNHLVALAALDHSIFTRLEVVSYVNLGDISDRFRATNILAPFRCYHLPNHFEQLFYQLMH